MISLYKDTATKDVASKSNAVYAFGRKTELDGAPRDAGGYALWVIRDRFVGQNGDLQRKWCVVEENLSYSDVVALMNKRVHHTAFEEK